MRLIALSTAFVIFTAYTVSVMISRGILGFVTLAAAEPWGMQLLLDLLVMLTLFALWVFRDAPAHGLPRWLYVILTLTMGSMGALAYLVHREIVVRRSGRASPAEVAQ